MAEPHTLARPYAEAVFELAERDDALAAWSDALAAIAAIVANDDMAALMGSPVVTDEALADTVIGIAGDDLSPAAQNFVRVLVDNGRLALAPAIAELFETRRAEAEARIDVQVTSAVALDDEQQAALGKALEQRLARSIRLRFDQDESVIGGAVIRAGDLVIDGSLRAQLERMRRSLTH